MLLIEMDGENSPKFRLEFHPRVTIVSQLSPEMRLRIASSLNSALFGDPTDLKLSVDYGGRPQLLTQELLASVGMLRKTMDNVIAAADLPGAVVLGDNPDGPAPELPVAEAQPEPVQQPQVAFQPVETPGERSPRHIRETAVGSPVEQARNELAEAEAYVQELEQKLEAARLGSSDVSPEDVERAADALKQARSITTELRVQIEDLRDQLDNPTRESKVVSVMRLRQVESSINERIHQLRESLEAPSDDMREVKRCLDAASDSQALESAKVKRELLERRLQHHDDELAQVQRLESQPRPPAWLVAQTKEEMEEAEARITAFTYQLKEGIDVKKQLKKAQEQFVEAQAAWDELENGIEGELRIARERVGESLRAIGDALGVSGEVDEDIIAVAREETERLRNTHDPRVELMNALTKNGLVATIETAVHVATEWLKEQSTSEAVHAGVQQQLAAALLDLGGVRKQIADISNESDALNDRAAITAKIEMLQEEYEEAVGAQRQAEAYHSDLASRVVVTDPAAIAKLETQYREAVEFVEACGRKVDYFASLDALAHDDVPVPLPAAEAETEAPWWEGRESQATAVVATPAFKTVAVDVSQISESDIEMYILARAAGLRSVAHGESVPLILDGTFDELAPHFALRLLDGLARISSSVQIVYLSSTGIGDRWLKGQSEDLAAAVSPELRQG